MRYLRFVPAALLLALTAAPAVQARPDPAPSPAAEPVIHSCTPGPWILFFPRNSAKLMPASRAVLDEVARAWREKPCGPMSILFTAHIDPGETHGLDARRARAVRNYLKRRGLPAGSMTSYVLGTSEPRVAAPIGVEEPQNQRVEVMASPP
jgi:outer membrane protein OmpA-like peptidoglycan-associated protein